MQKAIKKYFPIFVLPTMIAFTIGFLAPFLLGIWLSFCKFTTVTDAEFIGLGNYLKILGDKEFIHAMWYTALFTIVTVLIINILAFAVALLLTKGIKGTNVFRTIFFMPNLIGGIVLGYVWQLLLNGILANFGRTLTYSEVYGFWGLVILMCWQQVGYMMIIYIAGIQNVPGDLIEAAKIDGANKWQLIRYIDIPGIAPTAIMMLILEVGKIMNIGFQKAYLMQNGLNITASEIIPTYIYKIGLIDTQYSYSAAISLFNNIVNIILLVTVNKIAQKTSDSSLW